MQRPSEMGKHGAQPPAVHDPAGKITELVLHAGELPSQSGGTRSGRTFLAEKRLVMGDDVVELAERALALDSEAEIGLARSGIAPNMATEACLYCVLPAMVPNGRLAMDKATVRRNCRVVKFQGSSPMRGMAGSPSERASRPSRKRLSVVLSVML